MNILLFDIYVFLLIITDGVNQYSFWKVFRQDQLNKYQISSNVSLLNVFFILINITISFPIDNGGLFTQVNKETLTKLDLNYLDQQAFDVILVSQQRKEINDDCLKKGLFCRKKIKIDQNENHQNYFDGVSKVKCKNEELNEGNVVIKNDMNLSFEEQKFDLILEYHLENSIQYISGETLVLFKMTISVQTMKLHDVLIYDGRYEYEFQGGHISSATHLNHLINLSEALFGGTQQSKKIVVLYCEFSIRRSKEKYFEIRKLDRSMNEYPKLTYNNLYILSKGYSEFYKQFQYMCNGNYVTMNDPTYEQELKQELRNIAKQKNKLKQIQKITGCLI